MKSATLRIRNIALLLLAPVAAAMFLVKPAQAQVYGQVYVTPQMAPLPAVVVDPGYNHRGWDRRGPTISDVAPHNGERVHERGRTEVSARINDSRSGIDYSSVSLRIDGRDVTRRTRVGTDEVRYRQDFAPGRHVAELTVRDRAGNTSRESWTFDVRDARWGERWDDRRGERHAEYDRR